MRAMNALRTHSLDYPYRPYEFFVAACFANLYLFQESTNPCLATARYTISRQREHSGHL